jgi:hypothetical protein
MNKLVNLFFILAVLGVVVIGAISCIFPTPNSVMGQRCTVTFKTLANYRDSEGNIVIRPKEVESLVCNSVWMDPK